MGYKKRNILGSIVFLCLILFGFPLKNMADTFVNGIQSGIWTKDNSPYIVSDDVIIPEEVSSSTAEIIGTNVGKMRINKTNI